MCYGHEQVKRDFSMKGTRVYIFFYTVTLQIQFNNKT